MLLPNGDWQSDTIEVYVPQDSSLTPDAMEEQLANGLVTALAGAQYDSYPRHRWTGADLAVDQCGLLESVHRLGSGTYARFLDLLAGTAGSRAEAEPVLPDEPFLGIEDMRQPQPGVDAGETGTKQTCHVRCIHWNLSCFLRGMPVMLCIQNAESTMISHIVSLAAMAVSHARHTTAETGGLGRSWCHLYVRTAG